MAARTAGAGSGPTCSPGRSLTPPRSVGCLLTTTSCHTSTACSAAAGGSTTPCALRTTLDRLAAEGQRVYGSTGLSELGDGLRGPQDARLRRGGFCGRKVLPLSERSAAVRDGQPADIHDGCGAGRRRAGPGAWLAQGGRLPAPCPHGPQTLFGFRRFDRFCSLPSITAQDCSWVAALVGGRRTCTQRTRCWSWRRTARSPSPPCSPPVTPSSSASEPQPAGATCRRQQIRLQGLGLALNGCDGIWPASGRLF